MFTDYTESEWHGYRRLDFIFEDKPALLICPAAPTPDKKWLFRTEYFGCFEEFEVDMLSRGYYDAHVDTATNWTLPEDTERQARFVKFLHEEFGLASRCMPVGMSCGGMQAIYLAAKHPETVAAIYADAPVVNLLSCPCGVGDAENDLYPSFLGARGMTVSDLINYREHPLDYIDKLIEHRVPLFLVAGDSDRTVPFHENGAELQKAYEKTDIPFELVIKPGCDHHPHGLDDRTKLIAFTLKNY